MAVEKWGSEFIVNSSQVGGQSHSEISVLSDGRFVVIWYHEPIGANLMAQIFNADGSPSGQEFIVAADSARGHGLVTALQDGGFVVSYSYDTGDFHIDTEVVFQIYNAQGELQGEPIPAHGLRYQTQSASSLTTLSDGRFAVAWEDSRTLSYNVKIFNPDGTVAVDEIFIPSAKAGGQLTALSDGGFVVIWYDGPQDSFDTTLGVGAQVFNADGSARTAPFMASTDLRSAQQVPTVTGLVDGGFVIAWEDYSTAQTGGDSEIRTQAFDANGNKIGDAFVTNTTTFAGQGNPSIAALSQGGYVIVWTDRSNLGGDNSETSIKAQVFDASGAKVDSEILVNTVTASYQAFAKVSAMPDGRFVVTWTDASAGAFDIRAQIFDPRSQAASWTGTAAGEQFGGTAFNDSLYGIAGADTLFGAAGDDILDGGSGNDRIEGGAGRDQILGGADLDTASYASASAGVTVDLTTGVGGGSDAEGDTLSGIENLVGSSHADTLTGDAQSNGIAGGDGNDNLFGLSGNDVLEGGIGADRLEGGGGADTATYERAGARVSIALGGTGTAGEAAGDVLIEIENLVGSSFDDRLQGDSGSNSLAGRAGSDVIVGADGDDTLDGGDGDDMLEGGRGADRLVGGVGRDTASYQSATVAVAVSLATGLGLTGEASGDVLTGIENLTGSSFNDTLTGDSGANVLSGLSGADRLDGGAGVDAASYENASGAVVANLATGTGTAGDAAGDVLVNMEDLVGSAFADTLIGDNGANTLAGRDGADRLEGGGGVDTADYAQATSAVTVDLATGVNAGGDAQGDVLVSIENLVGSAWSDTLTGDGGANIIAGGAGNDVIDTGAGNDTIIAGAGNDQYRGGDGIDTLSYERSTRGVTVHLGTQMAQATFEGFDTISGIENIRGSAFDDSLWGNELANVFDGGAGNDFLYGGTGRNRLIGGTGDDGLQGGVADPTTFVFGAGFGHDVVVGFRARNNVPSYLSNDILEFDPAVFNSFSAVMAAARDDGDGGTIIQLDGGNSISLLQVALSSLSEQDFAFVSPGMEGDDVLQSTAGNDTLNGGAGVDTASYATAASGVTVSLSTTGPQNTGGAGTDTLISIENLTGSSFADTLVGNAEANRLAGGDGNDRIAGGLGKDSLTGGGGRDVFDFDAIGESSVGAASRDVITDFAVGVDDIDLSGIDANTTKGGNGAFKFVGTQNFSKAGDLRYQWIDDTATANDVTIVSGDVDGDRLADFEIALAGLVPLTSSDFIL